MNVGKQFTLNVFVFARLKFQGHCPFQPVSKICDFYLNEF